MNKTFGEAEKLIADIGASLEGMELKDMEVILCPPLSILKWPQILQRKASSGSELKT